MKDKKKGTFIIKIDHCQNETWQGKVVWAEGETTERFRSSLELLKLMDEALNANEANSADSQDEIGKSAG